MNTSGFNPRQTALLEEPLPEPIEAPDSSFAAVTHFEPDKLSPDVHSDKKTLLVLSEVYYPRGWEVILENGEDRKKKICITTGMRSYTLYHKTSCLAVKNCSFFNFQYRFCNFPTFLYGSAKTSGNRYR